MDSSSSPSSASSTVSSPFRGAGNSWKRTLLFSVLGLVVVGGAASYVMRSSSGELAISLQDGSSLNVIYNEDDSLYGAAEEIDDFDVVASATPGYSTFLDYYYGYSIDFPEAWTLDPDYDFTSFSSEYESFEDYLLENFNMGIEDTSTYPGLTLEEYMESARGFIGSDPYYTFESEGAQRMGAYEGWYFLGTYNIGGGEKAGVKSFFTLYDDKAYVLTYMYEMPEKEVYQAVIEHVLSSFALIDVSMYEVQEDADAVESASSEDDFGFASVLHLSAKSL